jgi:nucleoside-diphosphate-sugar epimerase
LRIFLTGGIGVIGRRVLRRLVSQGHILTAAIRNESRRTGIPAIDLRLVMVDLFNSREVLEAVRGDDVIIHLATRIPPSSKAGLRYFWRENDRLRSIASRHLVEASLAGDAVPFIQESIAGIYPDRGDEWIDETVTPQPAPYACSVLEAEQQAMRVIQAGRLGIVLRFGVFYGPDSGHVLDAIWLAKMGLAATLGSKVGFISSIGTDDAAQAFVDALGVDAAPESQVPRRDGRQYARALVTNLELALS